jgi:hypothetical protein
MLLLLYEYDKIIQCALMHNRCHIPDIGLCIISYYISHYIISYIVLYIIL